MKVQSRILAVLLAAFPATLLAQPAGGPPVTNRAEVQVTPLELNSAEDDFGAFAVRGEHSIIFTSARRGLNGGSGDQRIWSGRKETAGWVDLKDAGAGLARGEHVGTASVTPDGNFMVFASYEWDPASEADAGSGRTDLFSAERIGGTWANIRNLGSAVNSPYWDSQPALSADGRTLYFASDRPGGVGGVDLYVTTLSSTGWTTPQAVGSPVNTLFDEMAPTIAPDGKRLFFSSNGHGGVGGFDIFMVAGGDRALGWGDLQNMGTPINSAADEYFYTSIPNSRNAYFSSDRSGNFDIYTAYPNPFPPEDMVTVGGRVLESGTNIPLGSRITITDLSSGEVVANYHTDSENGEYYVLLTKGRRYSVTAEAPDHIFYSDEYSVPPNTTAKNLKKDIELYRTSGGTTRLLVFFDYDKSDLKSESKPDLNRAIEFLRANPSVKVEIAGHTDSMGSDTYNERLSQSRAESVRKYLEDAGVAPARMLARGYGESRPVDDNGTDPGRARNRRVEMNVLTEGGTPSSTPRR